MKEKILTERLILLPFINRRPMGGFLSVIWSGTDGRRDDDIVDGGDVESRGKYQMNFYEKKKFINYMFDFHHYLLLNIKKYFHFFS
jgi:hypothetical protein